MQLIIFGGGRWAQEICKEACKLSLLKKIIIVSKNNKINLNKFKKKIILTNIFSKKYINNKTKIIISNNVENHIKTLKKINIFKNKILIEKPLFKSVNDLKYIIRKKNIYFSRVWSFDKYLKLFSNKIKKYKIQQVKIYWFDKKKEIRGNQVKKHDLKINYNFDIFSHLINLIEIITQKKIEKFESFKIYRNNMNESNFSINIKNIKFNFEISRIKNIRKRYIKILDQEENFHEINFSKKNILNQTKNKRIKKYSYNSSGNLYKMIKCFMYEKDNEKININYGINYLKIHNQIFNK